MAAGRLVIPGFFPAEDRNGDPVSGAKMYVYQVGTTTGVVVYAEEALATPLPNPVEANSAGQWPSIWAEGGTAEDPTQYSVTIVGPTGAVFRTPNSFDDVTPSMNAETASLILAEAAAEVAVAAMDGIAESLENAAESWLAVPFYGPSLVPLNEKLAIQNDARDFLGVGVDPQVLATDWTAAINEAIQQTPDYVVGAAYKVVLPPGYLKVTGPIVVNKAGIIIEGNGAGTTLYQAVHNEDFFQVTAGDVTLKEFRCLADAHGATQKFGVKISAAASGTRIYNVDLVNVYSGIQHLAVNLTIDTVYIKGLKPALGVAIWIDNIGANVLASKIFAGDGSNFPNQNAFAGLYVLQSGCIQISDSQFFKMGTACYAVPTGGNTAGAIYCANVQFDTSVYGCVLDGTNGFVTVAKFTGCWFSGHSQDGFRTIGKVQQLTLSACDTSNNLGYGRYYVNVQGLDDTGGQAAANGVDGCRLDDAHNFYIQGSFGVMGFAPYGGNAGNTGYGLHITNSGASNGRAYVRVNGNTAGGSLNVSAGADIVIVT